MIDHQPREAARRTAIGPNAGDVLTARGSSRRQATLTVVASPLVLAALSLHAANAMQSLTRLTHRGVGPTILLEPSYFVRQADLALASGDRDAAISFVQKAYLAFGQSSGQCEDAKAWDTGATGKNS
jgi:hypothetical protein